MNLNPMLLPVCVQDTLRSAGGCKAGKGTPYLAWLQRKTRAPFVVHWSFKPFHRLRPARASPSTSANLVKRSATGTNGNTNGNTNGSRSNKNADAIEFYQLWPPASTRDSPHGYPPDWHVSGVVVQMGFRGPGATLEVAVPYEYRQQKIGIHERQHLDRFVALQRTY
ncbi:hypothetical protein Trihar35433_628 [Trichoderma harzianum]|nr:hypothetical protein Trihar35433_628 [Trichoderma harzianum]